MELDQLKVIVTGGAAGLGEHFAKQLLAAGAQVAVGDVNEEGLAALPDGIHRRKLNVGDRDEMIAQASYDLSVQADPDGDWDATIERYPGAVVSNFDGQPELTEMDALIAFMQMLGTLVDFSTFTPDASR